jgi:hypothetical protein
MDIWTYPGARWWKFDFHTHMPASHDTPWYRKSLNLAPREWLLKYMAAGVDCVAVIDHNSGAWVDELKKAYVDLELENNRDDVSGFRKLAVFPGVEISVNGGIHILAIFDTSATSGDINGLLGKVGFHGTKGDSDSVMTKSVVEVILDVTTCGAIAIPAHADKRDGKGLLGLDDPITIRQAIETEGLLAVEWSDSAAEWPQSVAMQASRLAKVLGSDCHSFQGENIPGNHYT